MSVCLSEVQKGQQTAFEELELLFKDFQNKTYRSYFRPSCLQLLDLHNNIKKIIERSTYQLVEDLQSTPNHCQLYFRIKENSGIKVIANNLSQTIEYQNLTNSLQSTIELIQKICKFLQPLSKRKREEDSSSDGMDNSVNKDETLSHLLQNYESLKLPDNIDEIRKISNPDVRAAFIAALINRDYVPIIKIGLSKNELMQVAPHLTYLFCKDPAQQSSNALDEFMTKEEIDRFLEACINLKTLNIASRQITHLPAFKFCEFLNCSGCVKLERLPLLASCTEVQCNNCQALKEIISLPACRYLDVRECCMLSIFPALPECRQFYSDNSEKSPKIHLEGGKYLK